MGGGRPEECDPSWCELSCEMKRQTMSGSSRPSPLVRSSGEWGSPLGFPFRLFRPPRRERFIFADSGSAAPTGAPSIAPPPGA